MRTVHLLNRADLTILTRGTAFDIRCPCGLTHSIQSERAYGKAREGKALLALPPHRNDRNGHRKQYSASFKRKAVARVLGGEPVSQVAKDLGVWRSMLDTWRRRQGGRG